MLLLLLQQTRSRDREKILSVEFIFRFSPISMKIPLFEWMLFIQFQYLHRLPCLSMLYTSFINYRLWCLSRKLWCIQINISLFISVHLTTIFSLLDDIIISIFILFSLCEIAWKILMQITFISFYLCRNRTNFFFVLYFRIISLNLFIIKMRVLCEEECNFFIHFFWFEYELI